MLNTGGFARGVEVADRPGIVHFVFGKRCFFGWARHPSGEVWWFANPAHASEPSRAELEALSPKAWRAYLIELLAVDSPPARAIVEATEEIIGPWPTHDLPEVRTWHRDRMIVIGDAAHAASPSSGQGASMAIEDALVLAKCLRDVPEVERAIATYERMRRRRVEKIVAQGRRNGTAKNARTLWACRAGFLPSHDIPPRGQAGRDGLDSRASHRLGEPDRANRAKAIRRNVRYHADQVTCSGERSALSPRR